MSVRSLISAAAALLLCLQAGAQGRMFMSHRGVHLNSALCGENSLQALDFARKAGFDCIETDCRYTRDSVLVVIHDAKINRTFTMADGSPIQGDVMVADCTLDELRSRYRYKSARPENRVCIQTLREHLEHCRELGFTAFIEPKLNDSTGRYYLDIMKVADEVLGRSGYVITSNNFANGVIRNTLGIKDVKLMGLLYQTDWESMEALGGTIFAVSSTAYSADECREHLERARKAGYLTETACCLRNQKGQLRFDTYDKVWPLRRLSSYLATDMAAPDRYRRSSVVLKARGRCSDGTCLEAADSIGFGAVYVEARIEGDAVLNVAGDKFKAACSPDGKPRTIHYSRMFCDCRPAVELKGNIGKYKVTFISYE